MQGPAAGGAGEKPNGSGADQAFQVDLYSTERVRAAGWLRRGSVFRAGGIYATMAGGDSSLTLGGCDSLHSPFSRVQSSLCLHGEGHPKQETSFAVALAHTRETFC